MTIDLSKEIQQAKKALSIARSIQEDVDRIMRPTLSRGDIVRIARAAGYYATFRTQFTDYGRAETISVYARRKVSAVPCLSLGKIEVVAKLDEQALVALINSRFQDALKDAGPVRLTKEDIRQIVVACGYRCYFRNSYGVPESKAEYPAGCREVYAYKKGRGIYIGTLEKLTRMSEADLIALIALKNQRNKL